VEVIHSQNKPVRPRSSSPSTGVTSRLGGLSISSRVGKLSGLQGTAGELSGREILILYLRSIGKSEVVSTSNR
jgi:hypothetical protein